MGAGQIEGTSKGREIFLRIRGRTTKPKAVFRRVRSVEFVATLVSEFENVDVIDDLEVLFRAHYGRLVRALTIVAGSREAANDAVQEAFVKAHLNWRRVRRYDDPVGWIRRVAINKLRDEHRRQGRKERAMERIAVEQREATMQWSDGVDIGALLGGLPKQQRLAIAFFYVDGLSVAEVADTLGISEGAVKFHLHQGRERLRGIVAVRQDQP
jgi:RNA polymerase sigma-70 factor (ECF subfamily)